MQIDIKELVWSIKKILIWSRQKYKNKIISALNKDQKHKESFMKPSLRSSVWINNKV